MNYQTLLKWIFPILLLIVAGKVQKTNYNWDVVFYCGAIFNNPENPQASREAMIAAFEKSPYIDYEDQIIPKSQYGKDVFSNNQSYEEQYAFYDIRIVYITTIKIIHALGADAVYSVYLASLFYALLSLLVLYFFFLKLIKNSFFSFLACLFIILRPGFKEFITSSPDTVGAFSLILAMMAYFMQKKWLIYASVVFCIICRTDNIIFVGLLYGATIISSLIKKENLQIPLISIILSVITYLTVNWMFNNAGYRVLYYHTFLEHLSFPLTQPKMVSYQKIITVILPELAYFIYPLMYLLVLILVVRGNYKAIFTEPALLVGLAAIITFVIRFCLFPSSMPRFTFVYEFIGILLTVYYFRKPLYLFFNSDKKFV